MNYVEPIRDKDDIQAMKDYLREWNERNYMLFLLRGLTQAYELATSLI